MGIGGLFLALPSFNLASLPALLMVDDDGWVSSPWEATLLEPEEKQVKKLVEKKAIEKRLGFTE